jgi:cytosine/adenosine deaminase-related metal-dependent hydrolase
LSTILHARWILPIDVPPIADGWVECARGRIVRVGQGRPPRPAEDLGDVAVLPGLVNAHTHLELSWMAGLVPPASSMNDWIRTLVGLRRTASPGQDAEDRAARAAAASMHAVGTALVGDITNGLTTPRILREAGLSGVVFHELLGFRVADPVAFVGDAWARVDRVAKALAPGRADEAGRLAYSVVAHAPYSVSPALFGEIVRRARTAPLSIHLAESIEELEFLRTGRGPIRESLEAFGVWDEAWPVPGTDPVRYVADLHYLRPGVLIVHGVHLTRDGLERLRKADAVLVTCPRSNAWVGSGLPSVTRFYEEGLRVAIGTDSLASVSSLSMFDELAELRRIAPELAAARLLESATKVGAEALGFPDFGTIRAGQRSVFAIVSIPPGTTDVEEYLVSGVPTDRVHRRDWC